MKNKSKEVDTPLVGKLSFENIHKTLKKLKKSSDKNEKAFATDFLAELEAVPEFIKGTEDYSLIEKHRPLIDKMMQLLFPSSLTLNEIKGAMPPYNFDFFYTSERLNAILNNAGKDFEVKLSEMTDDRMYIMGCMYILAKYYKYPIGKSTPFIMEIPDKNGEIHYYRSAFNADLMEIRPTENAKEITEEDFWNLMDNQNNIEIWKEKIPPNSWEVYGLGLVTLMDITVDHTLNLMTSNLLEGGMDAGDKAIVNMRSLLKIDDLAVSFIGIQYDRLEGVRNYGEVTNILMDDKEEMTYEEAFTKSERDYLLNKQMAVIIPSIDRYPEQDSLIVKRLNKRGYKSYIIIPLIHNEEHIGMLELASPTERAINSTIADQMKLAVPIIAMAGNRFRQERMNRIEAIIQEECTSIHPSVKWRFERAAIDYLEAEEFGEKPEFTDLIFNEVYPLYGQMDIKSSSTLRNEAVKADLSLQLRSVKKVLRKAIDEEALPIYEEMMYRLDGYLNKINDDLVEGSEQRILSFLSTDIYPIFDYLKQESKTVAKAIDEYNEMLNPETKMIYDRRKDFDQSVNETNALLAELIDEKQKDAQKMFPHYFERYKTDGVEYNMYVGQSISEKKKFNQIYLNNLQLWQLASMCEMEHAFYRMRKNLAVPLEVASLVLIHNSPLSIHFRIDEKRFDVEGAYNARYEIIKKRVDKAHIKGTDERITVPGKIAIIYTSKEDALLYERHINYLESKGYVVPGSTEDVALEDLQGVSGLRALRVTVDYSYAEDLNINELISDSKKVENS